MKTYSIGRDLNCDIVINDSTDVISRRHALLNVAPSGKMTIVDQSSNGTYVNGIRISQNVPVPVTRKDIVSLAHVAKLDWKQVPKPNGWVKYVVGAVILAGIAVGIVFGVMAYRKASNEPGNDPATELATDSTALKTQDGLNEGDSVKIEQTKDSTITKDNAAKKEEKKKEAAEKPKEQKKKGKDTKVTQGSEDKKVKDSEKAEDNKGDAKDKKGSDEKGKNEENKATEVFV